MNRLTGRGIFLLCFCALVTAGCGTCKQDLENAKKEIAAITAQKQELSTQVTRLDAEKAELTEESEKLRKSNLSLQADTERLKRSGARLRNEVADLKRKNEEAVRTAEKLKAENAKLKKKIETLQEKITDLSSPRPDLAAPPAGKIGGSSPGKAGLKPGIGKSKGKGEAGPCDAVLGFMHKSAAAVRGLRGAERTKRLAAIKKEYAGKMKGAPAAAVKQARAWVAVLSEGWDKTGGGDMVLQLLTKRNAVLKACGKTPAEAGF
jgi:FtsZ-binding cell division protein ZapB